MIPSRLTLVSVLTAALLSGCGQVAVFGHVVGERPAPAASSPVTNTAAASEAPAKVAGAEGSKQPSAAVHALKSVTIKVASKADEGVASDAKFTPEALLDAVRTELRARGLLDEQKPDASGAAEIQVSEVTLRPASNAILFGYKTMSATLIGDVQLNGADKSTPPSFHVLAQTRVTISVQANKDGRGKDPLGPVYRRFAVLVADRLAGVESQPDPSTSGEIQRF